MHPIHKRLRTFLFMGLTGLSAMALSAPRPPDSQPATRHSAASLEEILLARTGTGRAAASTLPEETLFARAGTGRAAASIAANRAPDTNIASVVTLTAGSHAIVLEPDASPSEQHAAEQLQEWLQTCLGGAFDITKDPSSVELPMIVLGMGPNAENLGVSPSLESLGDQGFLIRTVAPHVVIAGTPAVGTLYGVYRFIEDQLNVRWLAPGVTQAPQSSEIGLPELDLLSKPAFKWRHTSYQWPDKDDEFLARMGDNNGDNDETAPYGVEYSHDGRAHSYFRFISPDEFFDTHPEYFSEIGGVRVREETQLCLTNPDVLEIVTERMLERMAEHPEDMQYNFSQQDHYNYCECENCRAMNEYYGTTGGTQFWFVNQLAERTSAVYPDKQIGTLAYTYTEEPPVNLEMHPNVAVWLCHMYPSCDSHPVSSCPLDAEYKRRAETWASLVEHLYIWHYVVDFTHYYTPFPNFDAMASDMKFYRNLGVEGIYLQGMGHSGGGGEFSLLRPYYGMKLLWNPDTDPDQLMNDFLQGYYGAASEPIRQYIRLLHDKVADEDIHMHLYTNPGQGYITDDLLARSKSLFRRAEYLVQDDAELLDRVQVARMPLIYAEIFPRNGYEIVNDRIDWQGHIASARDVDQFLGLMESHGFNNIMEFYGSYDLLGPLWAIFKTNPAIRTISNDMLEVEVVPMLAGRALRIIDKRSGKCATAYNVIKTLYFPFAGGMDDRVGGAEYYGWLEPGLVTAMSERSISTSSVTLDGFELDRTLTLDDTLPILHVESVLTNPDEDPRDAQLRNHLEIDLGTVADTQLEFTNRAGDLVQQDMTKVIEGLREGQHFYREQAPDGGWTFTGDKGLQLTQRFDNEDVDSTWLIAYPESLNEVEVELWAPAVTLQPGQSIVLRQEIQVDPI